MVSRTRVVRCRGALGRRWQTCPTVGSSILVSCTFVQFMGGADEKIEGPILLRRGGMRLSQGTQCQKAPTAGTSAVLLCSAAMQSDMP